MKLPYNEDELCFIKTKLWNFILVLLVNKLYIIGARLELNSVIFSGDIPVNFYS